MKGKLKQLKAWSKTEAGQQALAQLGTMIIINVTSTLIVTGITVGVSVAANKVVEAVTHTETPEVSES